jgi:ubiquinone/menaquinone biosynthesis C-methylase UbiE
MERSVGQEGSRAAATGRAWTDPTFAKLLMSRTATTNAAFVLPHLRPGMSLLDCGCGPGSITVDLAELLAPGEVVGVDIEPKNIDRARALARERGVTNARFEVGDVHELPFPDASFDAAFAHTLLQHVADPVGVLREMRRLLRPGGLVGVREEDWGSFILAPTDPALEQFRSVFELGFKGARFARRHREVLREAGFVRIEASAAVECHGTAEETQRFGDRAAGYVDESWGPRVVRAGKADAAAVDAMAAAWRAWGQHADAFSALTWCQAVAWKPEGR